MTKCLFLCSQAAKAAAEGVAKAAARAASRGNVVKQEKVRIQHNLTKTAHSFLTDRIMMWITVNTRTGE